MGDGVKRRKERWRWANHGDACTVAVLVVVCGGGEEKRQRTDRVGAS